MSTFSKRIAFAFSFLLLLPAIATVAAPPPMTIHNPIISPTTPGPSDQVTVNVTVTPGASVQNVSIHYTTDNWARTNTTVLVSYNPTTQFGIAQIPAQTNGGHVEYYIVGFDNNNNKVVNNNGGNYFSYTVFVPPPPNTTGLWIEIAIVVVAVGAAVAVGIYSFHPKTTKSTSD